MRSGTWMLGIGLGAAALASTGCVSLDKYTRLKAANRTLTAEKESVGQELFDERHMNDSLRTKVDALDRELVAKVHVVGAEPHRHASGGHVIIRLSEQTKCFLSGRKKQLRVVKRPTCPAQAFIGLSAGFLVDDCLEAVTGLLPGAARRCSKASLYQGLLLAHRRQNSSTADLRWL